MTTLKPVKIGWKWLEKVINMLIDAINARTISVPLGGGIDIRESTNGTLISLSRTGTTSTDLAGDDLAILRVLAQDPGSAGTGTDGKIEFIPWKSGAQTGWRKITYLQPITAAGVTSNALVDVWMWAGNPFNSRACDSNTFGGS